MAKEEIGFPTLGMSIQWNQTLMKKLTILAEGAKYDVSCTSSGVTRKNGKSGIGNAVAAGICHSFSADGRCISLLKILYTNECIFDCKYCINRRSNDIERAVLTPEELAELTISFYKRNYIEGLFLSSGIYKTPDYTMEQLYRTVRLLREKYSFYGYIHVKAIPGADPVLIEQTGYYADRMSVNLELPTTEGLRKLAPNKTRRNILGPMRQIQNQIQQSRYEFEERKRISYRRSLPLLMNEDVSEGYLPSQNFVQKYRYNPIMTKDDTLFVPAGQSTQMIIGATEETDYELLQVTEALYQKFHLKRVYYSAFMNVNHDTFLPDTSDGPPLLREHRLYQADWLLRFYGFRAEELLSKEQPDFNMRLDPKCNWAVNHLEQFPVEINKADYYSLLRVPGIGVKSAKRIVAARRSSNLDFQSLKKIGVVLKRAVYFITCNGKMMYPLKIEAAYILNHMLELREKLPLGIEGEALYRQLSMFDITNL